MSKQVNKVVLAYSGGLDTSVILRWLIEIYDCEVVTFSADLGQVDDMAHIEANAYKTGAVKSHVEDLKEEFVRDFVFPAFRANAIYEGTYLLGTSIARPLIAKRQIEIAAAEGADAVSHGATGKGNDQVRFELGYLALNPQIKIIAPWREWDLNSRTALMAFAKQHGIDVPTTHSKPYSTDGNMLHISYEGGVLEDPWVAPPEDIFTLTNSPREAPDTPETIELTFDAGNPVAIDGEMLSPAAMLLRLNQLGARHGIGRVDLVENRFVGMKSRGVYETPGGTILRTAHMAMESITMDREVLYLRDALVPKYARLIYNGFWFSPEMRIMQQMVDQTQENVSGVVRLELYRGNCRVTGRKSERSLYREDFATFEDDAVYSHEDAEGFIRLNALRLRIQSMLEKKQGAGGGAMSAKLWDGRFAVKTDQVVEKFTSSIAIDRRLYRHDIEGSVAHCRMLARTGIISSEEMNTLVEGLATIRAEIEDGQFVYDDRLEDIHMHIEDRLGQLAGPVARKLHTARSRNDQVALDARLYLRAETGIVIRMLKRLREALVAMAHDQLGHVMPGYTHLQRAQPVLLSHHLLAYYEMFSRDSDRFADARVRMDVNPLGCAALAGTTFPIDRDYTAEQLGFRAVAANSMDAVADRDFMLEFIAAASIGMVHFSRLAEELILWSSAEFGFIELPDAFATGSSIMPQKKNPDVPELVRGKTGRVFGDLMALLTTMKSLPLAYNRDMQEDKASLFSTVDTLKDVIEVVARMLPQIRFNTAILQRESHIGFLNATDMADYLVGQGLAFREAHAVVGRAVSQALSQGKELHELSLPELKTFSPLIDEGVFTALQLERVVDRRTSWGGTATTRVRAAILKAREDLASEHLPGEEGEPS